MRSRRNTYHRPLPRMPVGATLRRKEMRGRCLVGPNMSSPVLRICLRSLASVGPVKTEFNWLMTSVSLPLGINAPMVPSRSSAWNYAGNFTRLQIHGAAVQQRLPSLPPVHRPAVRRRRGFFRRFRRGGLFDLVQRRFEPEPSAIGGKRLASFPDRPCVGRAFACQPRPRQFAARAQMMPGFMQQREDKPVVADRRMKGEAAENIHQMLAVRKRGLSVHGAYGLQDAVMHR